MSTKKFSNRCLFLKAQGKTKSNHEVLDFWQRSFHQGDVIIVFDVMAVYSLRVMNNQNVLVLQDTPQPVA